jgi:hypothetical protein
VYALRSDGSIDALTPGSEVAPPLPAGVAYVHVECTVAGALALRSDGQVVAWGQGAAGQLDVPALPAGQAYVKIARGHDHSLALRSDGALVAWGKNDKGQCNVPALPAGAVWLDMGALFGATVAIYGTKCDPAVSVYCTAKVNSSGCTPSIAMTGTPSGSETMGCVVSTTGLIPGMLGLYLHSTAGAQSLPFHGGTLCVGAPLWRHPVRSTGGTATPCSGALLEDFNAYRASGVDPALVAGAGVWLQSWSRDTAASFGDSLSDAVTATICP